jgi:hypothetical protein
MRYYAFTFKGGDALSAAELKQLKEFMNNNAPEVSRQLQMGLENTDVVGDRAAAKFARGEQLTREEADTLRFRREGRGLKYVLSNGCLQ